MFGSTHTIRRLAGLAVVAGAFAALAPIAQADSGFQGEPDAVDRAVAARQAEIGSSFQGSPTRSSVPSRRVRRSRTQRSMHVSTPS